MEGSARTTGREILYRGDGLRRPDSEVLKESGNIGLRLALLDDAMHRRAASTTLDSQYPPALFLSYKWGSDAENAWVADLAQRLSKHGWEVVFDQFRDETADRSVEEFVSRLMNCRVFVAVLSPAFHESAIVAKRASWCFDEMQCAVIAKSRMQLIGIVPPVELSNAVVEPAPVPVKMPPRADEIAIVVEEMTTPEFDEVYETRDIDDLERFLDQSLTYDGPGLDDSERAWIAERLVQGCDETVLRELLDRYPFISKAWRQLLVLLRDQGNIQAALEAAQQALDHVREAKERLAFEYEHIDLLKRSGDRLGAAREATQLIKRQPHDWCAHWHLGDLLDDANELWAARSHLLLACRGAHAKAEPHNTLAVVYMNLDLLDRAAVELNLALGYDATHASAQRNLDKVQTAKASSRQPEVTEVKGPLPGCSECEAIFVPRQDRPFTCAGCGASRSSPTVPCDVCGAEGLSLVDGLAGSSVAVYCPICRTGTVTSKDYATL